MKVLVMFDARIYAQFYSAKRFIASIKKMKEKQKRENTITTNTNSIR